MNTTTTPTPAETNILATKPLPLIKGMIGHQKRVLCCRGYLLSVSTGQRNFDTTTIIITGEGSDYTFESPFMGKNQIANNDILYFLDSFIGYNLLPTKKTGKDRL